MSWKKAHIISKWIFSIGLAPLQYIFVGAILLAIISTILSLIPNLISTIDHSKYGTILITTLAILGFFTYLFFVIKQLKEMNYDDFSFHFNRVKVGIILNYIGHLGLISIYALYLYCLTLPASSCSGIFIIPSLIWMFIFYLMGTSFTSLDRNIYKTKQQLDQLLQDNIILKEQYEEYLNALYHRGKISLPKALKKYKDHPSITIDEDENSHTITISNASKNTYQNLKSELLKFYALHGISIVIYNKETSWMIQNDQKNAYVSLNFDSKKNQIIIQWYKTDIPDFDVNTLQLSS
jgi:hypothetical protein